MDNPYKLTVQLRQYTPLLHFQGATEGACLRASEVKPKLDRFLWDFFHRNDINPPESWKLKTEEKPEDNREQNADGQKPKKGYDPALRYKLRFSGKMSPVEGHPLFFADEMDSRMKSIPVITQDEITMTVVMLDTSELEGSVVLYPDRKLHRPTLLQIMEELLPAFFSLHCFGMRSGKGFGSFEVIGNSGAEKGKEYCLMLDAYKEKSCLKLHHIARKGKPLLWPDSADTIYLLSMLMKGGISYPFSYQGQIHKQTHDSGYRTEKDFIREKVFPNEQEYGGNRTLLGWYQAAISKKYKLPASTDRQFLFSRAMLGLTDHYDFGVGKGEPNKKTIRVQETSGTIKRFANPVRFKPCENGFYILVNIIPGKMFKTEFGFSYQGGTPYPIETPDNTFDLPAFVDDLLAQMPNVRRSHGESMLQIGPDRENKKKIDRLLANLNVIY